MATYYGSDSASVQTSNPQTFYIGKMGAHDEDYPNRTEVNIGAGYDFNTTAADPSTYVYGYWWLGGPGADPNFGPSYTITQAKDWGAKQARAAIDAADGTTLSANGYKFSDYLTRTTIWADVEKSSTEHNYWLAPTFLIGKIEGKYFNDAVLSYFLQTLDQSGWHCGVYSSQYEWGQIFGSSSYSIDYTCNTGWAVDGLEFGSIPVVFNQYEQNPDLDSNSTGAWPT